MRIIGRTWRGYRRLFPSLQLAIAVFVAVLAGGLISSSEMTTVATTARGELSRGRARAPASTAPPLTLGVLTVTSVTDGDTLRVSDGRVVRLAQVDAPETGECFGSESTAALRRLAQAKPVILRRPPTGPEQDRYRRTLADVIISGASVNELLVREGAAEWGEQYASEDTDLAKRLSAAESEARADGRGLWSACAVSAAAAPPTTQAGAPPRSAASSGNCHASYVRTCIPPDVSDADCAGGSGNGPWYVKEKDIAVVGPDVFDLDRDTDGVGCES